MKRFLVLAFAILLALILFNRQRVYVRDPLATVYRNDVRQSGVEVYINASNDVLVWKEDSPGAFQVLLQHWNQTPGLPARLTCLHWMVCLADADHAAIFPIPFTGKGPHDAHVAMSDREVSFTTSDAATLRIELR